MALSAAGGRALAPFTARTRLLVVAPHPDDETLANGVLLQQVLAAGGTVRVLLLTAGENNPWPQRWLERRWRLDAAARGRWAQRRQAELDAALRALGVPAGALERFGWPDLGVLGRVQHPESGAVEQLRAALARFAPDVVALPALGDRHPDHGAAHVLLRLALAAWGGMPTLLEYLIHGAGATATAGVAATPAQLAAKREAVAAHRSQLALGGRRVRRWSTREERHCVLVPLPGTAPRRLPWRPSAPLRAVAWLTAVNAQGAVARWRWRAAPLVRDDDRWLLAWPAAVGPGPCFVRLSLDLPSPWIFDRWGWREI